ncbi:MAG: MBOAT family protein [Moorea sp. SIOASIH]|uniref:MBOAT family O-acyltransferase n=1 Tax=Moorena sp. SIOASIH TaxID=2607817 RepID=UPI0013BAAA8F|nr:MBOAT family protein [Moorena sp. SIOASIH]NEO37434.1 MBOAT family protein [Moorena sp. SIOASIH]
MLFNSYAFIFGFLPITLLVFFGLSRFRVVKATWVWMTLASLFFYGYWKIAYLPLLLISISGNYVIGKQIEKLVILLDEGSGDDNAAPDKPDKISSLVSKVVSYKQQTKLLLWIGIGFNLGILGYFKYANFFVDSLNHFLGTSITIPTILLPLAISFYSFTQIAYIVDAYRGETKKCRYNFMTYSLFVSFFPQLIAGPILRYDELLPQFEKLRNSLFSWKNMGMGLSLFILGLGKKVAIADNLSPWVATIFNNSDQLSFVEAWVGALSYTFQLYFDFSGYSDMAIGLGLITNIQLPINFNSPYKATSISDFWRRWHITLSNFLRDYLYIPLGGNRRGRLRQYGNLLATMLLGGLWHGAGWTFVIWGGLHGLFLVINHSWRQMKLSMPKILAWMLTFLAVVSTWVLFRATSISDGLGILQAMVGLKGVILPTTYQNTLGWLTPLGIQFQEWQEMKLLLPPIGLEKTFMVLFGLILGVTFLPNTQQIMKHFKPSWYWATGIGLIATFCLLSLNRVSEFLYFQF